MNQNPQTVLLVLPIAHFNLITVSLGKRPAEEVLATIDELRAQLAVQTGNSDPSRFVAEVERILSFIKPAPAPVAPPTPAVVPSS